MQSPSPATKRWKQGGVETWVTLMYRIDRRVWASVLFRTTTPDIIEGVIVKRSERLHWSRESAMEEAQGWADELTNPNPASKIEWRNVDYNMAIGRLVDQPNYTAVARSMLLPQGRPGATAKATKPMNVATITRISDFHRLEEGTVMSQSRRSRIGFRGGIADE